MIALFAGHHGKDSGAVNKADPASGDRYHTLEVAITPAIVSKVALFCSLLGIEHTVCAGGFDYRIESSKGCSAGVEIHCDSLPTNTDVRGFHCIHYPGSTGGKTLAESIDSSLAVFHHRARSVHAMGNLTILRKTAFPTVIVEVGFLTNPAEEGLLLQEHYQYNLAWGITEGLRNWINRRVK